MPESGYPNQHWGPRPREENTVWEDANGRQMHRPYLGSEQHGVPHIVQWDAWEHDTVAEESTIAEEGQVVVDPVPVVIVTRPMLATEKKIITSQWNLVQNAEPVQVVARRMERNKVHFVASAGAIVFLSFNSPQVKAQGFPVPTSSSMGWNTNQPVWAYTTSANSILYIAEEYEVKSGERIT